MREPQPHRSRTVWALGPIDMRAYCADLPLGSWDRPLGWFGCHPLTPCGEMLGVVGETERPCIWCTMLYLVQRR
eukprot:scaffold30408_cov69-Phaeocystis_antarctica.AAC.4